MTLGTGRGYAISTAAVAFFFWGGWAFAVNYGAATAARLTAGLVQGTASGIITLLMVQTVTWLYGKLPDRPGRLVLPAVLTVCVTGARWRCSMRWRARPVFCRRLRRG